MHVKLFSFVFYINLNTFKTGSHLLLLLSFYYALLISLYTYILPLTSYLLPSLLLFNQKQTISEQKWSVFGWKPYVCALPTTIHTTKSFLFHVWATIGSCKSMIRSWNVSTVIDLYRFLLIFIDFYWFLLISIDFIDFSFILWCFLMFFTVFHLRLIPRSALPHCTLLQKEKQPSAIPAQCMPRDSIFYHFHLPFISSKFSPVVCMIDIPPPLSIDR